MFCDEALIPEGTRVGYSPHYFREHCTSASSKDWDRQGVTCKVGLDYTSGCPWIKWDDDTTGARSANLLNIVALDQRDQEAVNALRLEAIAKAVRSLRAQEKELVQKAVSLIRPEFDKAKAAKDEQRMTEVIFTLPGEGLGHVERCFLLDEMRQALGVSG